MATERLICHILHYVPQRPTPDLDLVEDVIPLHDIRAGRAHRLDATCSLSCTRKIRASQ